MIWLLTLRQSSQVGLCCLGFKCYHGMSAEELVAYLKRQLAELGFKCIYFKNNHFVPNSIKLLHKIFHLVMNSSLGPTDLTSHTKGAVSALKNLLPN